MSGRNSKILDGYAAEVYEQRRVHQCALARVHESEAGVDELGRRHLAVQKAERALMTALLMYFGFCETRFGFRVDGTPTRSS